ncbi:hypothetical protein F5Y03DRAFT_390613 [Xylaria venustula]|nr:hypothetical protein F5Y03DRAFT_390613 [Xylaria venustula]
MCTYYYLHYHHVAPCSKGVEYAVQYSFCPNSTTDTFSTSPLGPNASASASASTSSAGGRGGEGGEGTEVVQQPCPMLTHAPEYDPVQGIDYTNPCATGGCLLSQHCVSGGCRLDELGGRWACCRCRRGGNTFRWCVHRVRKVPDALCYHVVCRNCRADA